MKLLGPALLAMLLTVTGARGATGRVAIVVGANAGLTDDVALRYAESDAQKIGKALTELGDFKNDEVHLLLGSNAEGLRTLLRGLATTSKSPALVFFYYSGHGGPSGLHLSGTKLAFTELKQLLEQLGSKMSIALVDSCGSGAMTRSKGARPGPAYEIEVLRDPEVEGKIVITSSSDDEIAQESDRLEGSFFTYYWVSGLYGAADGNGDEFVTLEEAFRFAHYRTIERTIETRAGVQRPSFALALAGQGQVVLSNLSRSNARLEVDAGKSGGQYFVLDADKKLLLTEITQTDRTGRASIRVPAGKYRIRKREEGGSLVLDLTLAPGQTRSISDAQMVAVPFEAQARKGEGGLHLVHQPQLNIAVRSSLISGMSPGIQAGGAYRLGAGLFYLQPQAHFLRARLENRRGAFRHTEVDVGLAVGLQTSRWILQLSAGIEGGLVFFDNSPINPILNSTPEGIVPIGLQGGLVGQVGIRVVAQLRLTVEVAPGLVVFKNEEQVTSGFVVRGGVGLLYSFE